MATAVFGDTPGDVSRNQALLENNPTARAIAAMQLLQSIGNQGAQRSGQASYERVAAQSAANEAERLRNALMLGREQYGSNERVAGLERTLRKEISDAEIGVRKLPFSPEILQHELDKARLGMRIDPYVERDIGKYNLESQELNSVAEAIAESANLAIDRAEKTIRADPPGWNPFTGEKRFQDAFTKTLETIDAQLGENRTLVTFDPARNRYVARKRPLIPIPRPQIPATPGATAVPVAPNPALMAPPAYGEPSLQMGIPGVPMIPTTPVGRVAVPVAPQIPVAAVAPVAVPPVPRQDLPFWSRPDPVRPYVNPNPQLEDPRVTTMRLMQEFQRASGR